LFPVFVPLPASRVRSPRYPTTRASASRSTRHPSALQDEKGYHLLYAIEKGLRTGWTSYYGC